GELGIRLSRRSSPARAARPAPSGHPSSVQGDDSTPASSRRARSRDPLLRPPRWGPKNETGTSPQARPGRWTSRRRRLPRQLERAPEGELAVLEEDPDLPPVRELALDEALGQRVLDVALDRAP